MTITTPSGRYALVKFVPDAIRFEPINVGLIVEFGDRVLTRMADAVDPRIRYADPYVDVGSLENFLAEFDAANYFATLAKTGRSPIDWLHEHGLANIYVAAPLPIEAVRTTLDDVVSELFSRLIRRVVERPPDAPRAPVSTAARTALREAFRTAGVKQHQIETAVIVRGSSGAEWRMDFRYVTAQAEVLIKAATTSLHEDVRRREHAYEAFTALIETSRSQAFVGILAADAGPETNEMSAQLDRLCAAHGFRFVAGRRAFLEFAGELRRTAISIHSPERIQSAQQLLPT